jgi:hypothetical protein
LDIRSFTTDQEGEPSSLSYAGDSLREVTQRVVRGLPLAQIREEHRQRAISAAEYGVKQLADEHPYMPQLLGALTAKGEPRKRAPSATDAELQHVANLYLAAVAAGHKTPAKTVEAALRAAGAPWLSHDATSARNQVRKWIERARDRGLITVGGRKER